MGSRDDDDVPFGSEHLTMKSAQGRKVRQFRVAPACPETDDAAPRIYRRAQSSSFFCHSGLREVVGRRRAFLKSKEECASLRDRVWGLSLRRRDLDRKRSSVASAENASLRKNGEPRDSHGRIQPAVWAIEKVSGRLRFRWDPTIPGWLNRNGEYRA